MKRNKSTNTGAYTWFVVFFWWTPVGCLLAKLTGTEFLAINGKQTWWKNDRARSSIMARRGEHAEVHVDTGIRGMDTHCQAIVI